MCTVVSLGDALEKQRFSAERWKLVRAAVVKSWLNAFDFRSDGISLRTTDILSLSEVTTTWRTRFHPSFTLSFAPQKYSIFSSELTCFRGFRPRKIRFQETIPKVKRLTTFNLISPLYHQPNLKCKLRLSLTHLVSF